jgi:hypothetical protein
LDDGGRVAFECEMRASFDDQEQKIQGLLNAEVSFQASRATVAEEQRC